LAIVNGSQETGREPSTVGKSRRADHREYGYAEANRTGSDPGKTQTKSDFY
jgi:hypothetical protein